jgi:hypothetical protein
MKKFIQKMCEKVYRRRIIAKPVENPYTHKWYKIIVHEIFGTAVKYEYKPFN